MQLRLFSAALCSAALVATALAPRSEARPQYVSIWQALYPGSLSLANVGASSSCQLCHVDPGGDDPWNGYGWDIREFMQNGSSINTAIQQAEGLDSDADPTGSTNLDEINADTQPGWTVGPNNTGYFENGSTQTNQNPPAGILGALDPDGGGISVVCDPANDHTQGSYTKLDTSTLGAPGGGFSGLHLEATDGPSGEFGYFLVSSAATANLAVSNGVLCLNGPQGRYAPAAGASLNSIGQFDGAGVYQSVVQAQQGWDVPVTLPAPPGGSIAGGDTWYFQMWYRDGQRSNFSNVIGVTF